METYDSSSVELISVNVSAAGKTEILYRPMLDSLYYCPGARIRHEADRQKLSLVRCKINDTCTVDVPAENLGQGQWKLTLAEAPESVDLVFRDREIPLPSDNK